LRCPDLYMRLNVKKKRRITTVPLPDGTGDARLPLHPEFLSFTIDTSLVMGGHWWGDSHEMTQGVASDVTEQLDFRTDRLVRFAKAVSPAMLRIGGTEADRLFYKPGEKAVSAFYAGQRHDDADASGAADLLSPQPQNIHAYEYVLKKGLWKNIQDFTKRTGMSLLFTVSAGLADRDAHGVWHEENAARLIAWSVKKKFRVAAWEFGNEINGFPFVYGWKYRVSAAQYARDFAKFGHLVRALAPESRIVGPASSVWPKIGEPNPILPGLCKSPAAVFLDVLSWHWYPQQSSRGRIATRRAGLFTLLSARSADSVLRYTARFTKHLSVAKRTRPAYGSCEQWITETGHALYGGEPGISDTFISTLWWLDSLGLFAREGIARVFRQSLIGSDYGLLDQLTCEPRPDFYASFFWKKIMGQRVLSIDCPDDKPSSLRLYVHASLDGGTQSILAVNFSVHREQICRFVPNQSGPVQLEQKYLLAGHAGVHSKILTVNGVIADEEIVFGWGKKKTAARYGIASFTEDEKNLVFTLPPHSAMFVVLIPFRPA